LLAAVLSSFVVLFSLVEQKKNTDNKRRTMLPFVLSLPALSLWKGRRVEGQVKAVESPTALVRSLEHKSAI
jgi:hypothetical protein